MGNIRGATEMLTRLQEDRREVRRLRREVRARLRDARRVARRDPVTVELLIDQALDHIADADEVDEQIDILIRNELEPMLKRRSKGEEDQVAARIAALDQQLQELRERIADQAVMPRLVRREDNTR